MLKKICVLTVLIFSSACKSGLPSEDRTLSASELTGLYKHSKTDLRGEYDGKEITIRGYIVIAAVMPGANEY